MKLNLYFKVKCYMAFQANAKEKRQHPLFAPSSSGFKEIYAFRNGNMIVRMISALRK
jgi:hypothetical protein